MKSKILLIMMKQFVNMDVKEQQCRMGVIPSFRIILGILWIYNHANTYNNEMGV
jgi:hypothetical protein